MSLTLKDLRVITRHSEGLAGVNKTRYATLADLVEVLKQEGAVDEITIGSQEPFVSILSFKSRTLPKPGRYLILPLGDTP